MPSRLIVTKGVGGGGGVNLYWAPEEKLQYNDFHWNVYEKGWWW